MAVGSDAAIFLLKSARNRHLPTSPSTNWKTPSELARQRADKIRLDRTGCRPDDSEETVLIAIHWLDHAAFPALISDFPSARCGNRLPRRCTADERLWNRGGTERIVGLLWSLLCGGGRFVLLRSHAGTRLPMRDRARASCPSRAARSQHLGSPRGIACPGVFGDSGGRR